MLATNLKQTIASWSSPNITLGAKETGFNDLGSQPHADGRTFRYMIRKTDGSGDYQECVGVYTHAGTLLSRDTVLEESVAGVVTRLPATPFAPDSTMMVISSGSALGGDGIRTSHFNTWGFTFDNWRLNDIGKAGGRYTNLSGRIAIKTGRFERPTLITEIGCYVLTASAGALARVGIYGCKPNGDIDNTLLVDSGDIDLSVTGRSFTTLSSPVLLPAGDYYVANMGNSTVAETQGLAARYAGPTGGMQGTDDPSGGHEEFRVYDETFGAFAADFSTYGAYDGQNAWASHDPIFR